MVVSSSPSVISPLLFSSATPLAEDGSVSGRNKDTRTTAREFNSSDRAAPWLKSMAGIRPNIKSAMPVVAAIDGSNNQMAQVVTPMDKPDMAPNRLAPRQ